MCLWVHVKTTHPTPRDKNPSCVVLYKGKIVLGFCPKHEERKEWRCWGECWLARSCFRVVFSWNIILWKHFGPGFIPLKKRGHDFISWLYIHMCVYVCSWVFRLSGMLSGSRSWRLFLSFQVHDSRTRLHSFQPSFAPLCIFSSRKFYSNNTPHTHTPANLHLLKIFKTLFFLNSHSTQNEWLKNVW